MSQLTDQLIKHEGLMLKPYRCSAGKLTIGAGHNLDDNGISEEIAMAILAEDMYSASVDLIHNFPWYKRLDPVRQDALINMCFNLGIYRLKGFKKMLSAFSVGNYQEAAKQALDSQWAVQVGKRSMDIAHMITEGEYP